MDSLHRIVSYVGVDTVKATSGVFQ